MDNKASLDKLKREAHQKGTLPERLLELAAMGPELAKAVAENPHTPPEVLAHLMYGDFVGVLAAAGNPATPPHDLNQVAQELLDLEELEGMDMFTPRFDPSEQRSLAAVLIKNPSLSPELSKALAAFSLHT